MNDRPAAPHDGPDPAVLAALRTMEPPEHGPAFWDELEARLAAEASPDPTAAVPPTPVPPGERPPADVIPLPPPKSHPRRWLAAVAAGLLVVVGATALLRSTSTKVTTTPATTSVSVEPPTSVEPPDTVTTAAPPPPTTVAPGPAPGGTVKGTAPATSVPRSSTTTKPTALTLSPAGVGPLRLGMTITQAKATGVVGAYQDSSGNGSCGLGSGSGTYRSTDFAALFLNGRLARIYAEPGSRLRTPQGIGVGTASSKLTAVAGTRTESPHPYGAGTNVQITSGNVGYQFTVNSGTVRFWSVGTKEGLALSEACS